MRNAGVAVLAAVLLVGGVAWGQEKYVVLSDIAWAPFEWVSEKGAYLGFDLDVMRAIAVLEGFEIEIRDTPFDSIIPAIIAGKGDIGAFGVHDHRRAGPGDHLLQAVLGGEPGGRRSCGIGPYGGQARRPGRIIGAQRGTTGAFWVEDNWVPSGSSSLSTRRTPRRSSTSSPAGSMPRWPTSIPRGWPSFSTRARSSSQGSSRRARSTGLWLPRAIRRGFFPRSSGGGEAQGARCLGPPHPGLLWAGPERDRGSVGEVHPDPPGGEGSLRYAQCLVAEVSK